MNNPHEHPISGTDFIRQFFPHSPYVSHLGMQLTEMQPGMATLTMPFTEAGAVTEPSVSVPTATTQKFAATAAAETEVDPQAFRSSA